MTEITNIDHWNQDFVAKDLKLQANQLTDQQEQIQERLRSILDELKESFHTYDAHFFEEKFEETEETNIEHLKKFLDTEDNEDLKIVLNFPRENGMTMLHDVADFYDGVTELLLDAGADPNIPDKDGKTPLQIAIDYRRYSAVGLFLNDKLKRLPDKQKELNDELLNLLKEVDYTSTREKLNLEHSVDSDSIAALKKFLDYNKRENNEDLKVVLNLQRGELGSTVLHNVHSLFYTETFNLLLEAGADPNIQDVEGKTPLHIAAQCDYQDVAQMLLDKGANPNIEDNQGNTPFHFAIIAERLGIVQSFLESDGTNINLQNKKTGESPIFDAVATNKDGGRIADSIIKKGEIDLSIRNERGMTALHQAVYCGKDSTVNVLLERGANASDIDYEGRNPLHFAGLNMWRARNSNDNQSREEGCDYYTIEKPDENIIATMNTLIGHHVKAFQAQLQNKYKLLQQETNEEHRIEIMDEINALYSDFYTEKEKYVNTKDKNGNTPLFYAIESEKPDVIIKLLGEGAKVKVIDKNGYTPFHYAIKSKNSEILELLLLSPFKRAENMNNIERALMKNTSQKFSNMHNLVKQDKCFNLAICITEKVIPSISYKDNNEGFINKKIDNMFSDYMKEDKESYDAVRNEISKIVISVVKKTHTRLSIRDKEGNTLLHHAIKWGCGEEILDFLVKNGVDINAKNNNSVAPIHIAAKYGKLSQMQYLGQRGADLNARCGNFTNSDIDNVGKEFPKDSKIDDEFSRMSKYINISDGNMDASSTVNVRNNTSYEGATPTFIAADNLNADAVNMLASEGADSNISNKIGATPLHVVAARILNKNYKEHKISDTYAMFEGLALFSTDNLLHCKKLIETLDGSTQTKEKLYKILDKVNQSKENNKECTAPVDIEASAPVFDESFYGKIDVHEIPDLHPDSSDKIKKLAVGNYGVTEWNLELDHSGLAHQQEVTAEEIKNGWGEKVDNDDIKVDDGVSGSGWSYTSQPKAWDSLLDNKHKQEKELSLKQANNGESYIDNNLNIQNVEQKEKPATEISSEKQPISTKNDGSGNLNTQGVERKEESAEPRTKLENLFTKAVQSSEKEIDNVNKLNDNSALVKLAEDQQKKQQIKQQNKFLSKVSKAQNLVELSKIVDEALKSGVRLNSSDDKEHSLTDLVITQINKLNGTKQDLKATRKIVCNLVAKGAILNGSYKKINEELEKSKDFEDHKFNIQQANTKFCKYINEFQCIVKNAIKKGKLQNLDIDNTTFFLEYSQDSIIDVAKIIDGTKSLGLNQGDIAFGGNIVKIGENAVEIEIKDNGKRNYTDISDSGDVILTFQTSLGELDVRLYSDTQNKDVIKVEVSDRQIFNQLINKNEEIGKNCLFGGLSVCDAIRQGSFERSGKLQSFEIINPSVQEKVGERTKNLKHDRINPTNTEKSWQNRVEKEKAIIANSLDTRGI